MPIAAALAATAAGASGYWAHAAVQQGAVNPPGVEAATGGAPGSFADIVMRVAPAVVSIDVVQSVKANTESLGGPVPQDGPGGPFGFDLRRFFQGAPPLARPPVRASGSGFFVSSDGYVVTNNHVVDGAREITVRTKDGRDLPARLVGQDPATDLAVLKVEGRAFPFVSFEDQARPRVGDWVVAVGNPFGLGGTATAGIVSALKRPNVSGSSFVDYMQIDAPINRGNSGGPTFDVQGRVVGVNTAIFSPSGGSVGIGFDIPAEVAAQVTRELIAHGKVARGHIGATIQNVTPEIAESLGARGRKGALVAEVASGGPAARAGLQPGDMVLSVDGRPIASASDLTRQVALAPPGDTISLRIWRGGADRIVSIRTDVRPSQLALGAEASPNSGDGAGVLGMQLAPSSSGGLTVQSVDPGSDAAARGLRPGDVIRQADGRKLSSLAELAQAQDAALRAGRKSVLLLVARAGSQRFVPVNLEHETG